MADEQKKQELLMIAGLLGNLDYYQILKVDRTAPLPEVKKAFFRESQAYHPDRFYGASDEELKNAVMTVYKRVAEAYAVVKDPELRAKYDQQLANGNRRLDRREASAPAGVQADPKAKNPQAQKYLQLGLMALRKGDLNGAEMNLKFALNFEPGNEGIQKKLKEAQDRKAKDGGGSKDPYRIA